MLSVSRKDRDVEDMTSAAEFASLQEHAEALSWDNVRPILQTAWGRPPEQLLSDVERSGLAASLGQVHRAKLHDGTDVAVKVQYPDIRAAVRHDLSCLSWLSLPFGGLARGFDLAEYRNTLSTNLDHELDYRREADRQRAFGEWSRDEPWLVVPAVIDELSTDNVLVSKWEQGERWDDVRDGWPNELRHQLATQMLQLFLNGLFQRRMLHADWHPGNFRFRREGNSVRIVLFDFGCIFAPPNNAVLALARLIQTTIDGDESPWPLLLELGFNRDLLEPLSQKLPSLCRLLFEPFCADHPYDIDTWRLGERVSDVLGDDRWNFRFAGPPELLFLMRAFHGLLFFLEGLGVPLSWRDEWNRCSAELSHDWDKRSLTASIPEYCDSGTHARHLKIRVREQGQTRVELTLRAECVDSLSDMLPLDVAEKVFQWNVDVDAIVARVRRQGYVPGPVFEFTDGPKQVQLWLE